MAKRKDFIPISYTMGGYGSLIMGIDGEVLYKAYNAITGEEVTVVLFTSMDTLESFVNAINGLTEQHAAYSELHQLGHPIIDLTPANIDFSTMMSELKKSGKSN